MSYCNRFCKAAVGQGVQHKCPSLANSYWHKTCMHKLSAIMSKLLMIMLLNTISHLARVLHIIAADVLSCNQAGTASERKRTTQLNRNPTSTGKHTTLFMHMHAITRACALLFVMETSPQCAIPHPTITCLTKHAVQLIME